MPIEFRCSQCGRLLRTPDDSAGRQAKCPECGNVQVVPESSAPAPSSPPPQEVPGGSPFGGTPAPGPGYDPNNPYQSPQYAAGAVPPYPGPAHRQYAADRVRGPAIGLIVTGALGVGWQLLNMAAVVVQLQVFPGMGNRNFANAAFVPFPMRISLAIGILVLVLGAIVIYGGIKMKNLESNSLAIASAVIAMIPCFSPCCLLGLPFGIWALVVLNDPAVKMSFRQ